MRQRRPGVWELIVQLPRDPTQARARQLSRTVHGTKREAQRALAELIGQVSAGKVSSAATPLSELLARWLDHVAEQLSPTTLREYRRLVRTMLDPDLGRLPLRRVTAQRIDAYYASLARERELSPASIRHVHAVLRGALGQAVRWGWIPTNPATNASPPKLRSREITPPPMHATHRLLEAADEYDPDFGAILRVLVAGARRGEVCGLRWSDVDDTASTITIRRSVASVAGGTVVKETKTHAARRIAVDPETMEALAQRRDRAEQLAQACQVPLKSDGFVFTSEPDGSRPLHPDTITGGFQRLRERTGLAGVRLHDLRHLHATQLLAAGVPVRTVSGRLGHANAATTLNVYGHFLEASDRQAADVIGGLLATPTRRRNDASSSAPPPAAAAEGASSALDA
jgi:integrase